MYKNFETLQLPAYNSFLMPLNSTSMPRIYDIISGFLLLPSNSWHNKFDLFFRSLSPQYITILQTYLMKNHYDNQHLIVYPTQLQSDLFWAVASLVEPLIYSHFIERSTTL